LKIALIAGASGLIGRACVRLLLDSQDYARTIAVVRRPTGIHHPKFEERVCSFEALGSLRPVAADAAFCALGTTLRQAGSKDAFYAVDHDYVANFAYWARSGGAETLCAVSSVGADPASGSFYLATKGDMEQAVREQRFPRLEIFRPSVLLGARAEQRLGERVAGAFLSTISPILIGPMNRWRPVQAESVARAMTACPLQPGQGTRIHHYAEIMRLAGA
jgi:uncharacterized protein YbjT (DUF2867 family)